MKRNILLLVVVFLIAIQFVHFEKNQSTEILPTDITQVTTIPEDVLTILKTSCYDCHSNNTVYPWYDKIQPISFWLKRHVDNGKKHLNFSDFGSYDAARKSKKMREIAEEIEKGDMPLSSYTLIHKEAVLTEAQKTLVINWTKSATFEQKNN
ncbi:MAG: hypothetical protein RJA25_1919 [Bacteroidota bacterium]|jgi:hypothetical protein